MNLLHKRIGSYTVVSGPIRQFVPPHGTIIKWRCECDCGEMVTLAGTWLTWLAKNEPEKLCCLECRGKSNKARVKQ